jgi:microsomal dipeptidase-like Zn-dependent dipeptidase
MQYYQFIMRHNNIYPEDRIPIICSHTGVNGYESMEESLWWKDNGKKFRGSYYNNWSINLSNEEIRIIHDSRGIVGLMMDKGLLAGPDTLKVVRLMVDVEMKKRIFVRMILDNIFSIIKAVGKRSAWDIITIGSDYDGLITHIDCYENVTKIPVLKMDLIQFLHTTQYKKDLWFELKPEEMMNKIFSTNLYQFLQRNFH